MITGAEPDNYEKQFQTAAWLIENGADFYAYVPALAYGDDTEMKVEEFANSLMAIDCKLPLRLEILAVVDFPGALQNYERTARIGRPMPQNDQRKVFDIWYNKIITGMYPASERKKFCCQIPLGRCAK